MSTNPEYLRLQRSAQSLIANEREAYLAGELTRDEFVMYERLIRRAADNIWHIYGTYQDILDHVDEVRPHGSEQLPLILPGPGTIDDRL